MLFGTLRDKNSTFVIEGVVGDIPNDMNMHSFSPEKLKTLREEAGLDQSGLADKCGITQQAISKFELGKSSPKEEDLRKIGKALRVIFIADWLDDNWEKETPRYNKQGDQ
jgi:transcriptional regulator with XRE-family HTH domain